MGKAIYEGVSGVARKVKNVYEGVSGVARKVKAGWVGVGGVARQFWSGGNIITSLTRNNKCWIDKSNSNYIYIQSNEGSDEEIIRAYANVYGDFAGKSYSFTCASTDASDNKAVYIEIYTGSSWSTLSFKSKTTLTGTFPSYDGTFFRFKTGNNRDYTGGIYVYSVILDGTEYIDYLRTATWPTE